MELVKFTDEEGNIVIFETSNDSEAGGKLIFPYHLK